MEAIASTVMTRCNDALSACARWCREWTESWMQITAVLGVLAYPLGKELLGLGPRFAWANRLRGPVVGATALAAVMGWFVIGAVQSIIYRRQMAEAITEGTSESKIRRDALTTVYTDRGMRSLETIMMLVLGGVMCVAAGEK